MEFTEIWTMLLVIWLYLSAVGSNSQFIYPSDRYLLSVSHVLGMTVGDTRMNKSLQSEGNADMKSIQQICIGCLECAWPLIEANMLENNDS